MKKSKFLLTIMLVLSLTFSFTVSNVNAAQTWDYYFGAYNGVTGGSKGRLISQTSSGWQVYLESVGSAGRWGAKVNSTFSLNSHSSTNSVYTLSCKLFSSDCNKWVFICIQDSDSEKSLFEDWVHLKKGKTVSYQTDITLSSSSPVVNFGIGGGEKTDSNASASTSITCSDFRLSTKRTTTVSNQNKLGKTAIKKIKRSSKKAKITLKKITNAAFYEIKYSTNKNFKAKKTKTVTSSKNKYTIKKLKKNTKYYVKARAYRYSSGTKVYGKWSTRKVIPKK